MRMLKIDMDITPPKKWLLLWIAKRKQMLESMGHTVERIDYFKSSKRGYHFYIRLKEDITDEWGNMLQFLCGDDQTRVKINQWRIKRKMKYWNKLFHRVLYRKKAPKTLTCYYCNNKIPVPDRWFENG